MQIVTAWNGMGVSALARASRVLASESPYAQPLFPVEGCPPAAYLEAAVKVARFVRANLWDEDRRRLRRAYCKAPSAVEGVCKSVACVEFMRLKAVHCKSNPMPSCYHSVLPVQGIKRTNLAHALLL